MNEQVVTDLLQSKQWASAQIVSIAGEQVILGWVENMVRLFWNSVFLDFELPKHILTLSLCTKKMET